MHRGYPAPQCLAAEVHDQVAGLLSVGDLDHRSCPRVTRCAAGEQSESAAAQPERLDELGDGAQTGGALRVPEHQAAAVGIHRLDGDPGLSNSTPSFPN